MRTECARDPSMWNSNGHVRAPFYIPLSCVSLNTYTRLVRKGGFLPSMSTRSACARGEPLGERGDDSLTGDDDA